MHSSRNYLKLIPDPTLVALGNDPEEMTRWWLCVAWEFTDLERPIIFTDYYPVRKVDRHFYQGLDGRTAYPYLQGSYKDQTGAVYYLQNRGSTLPMHREERPAPQPRAKELRWVRGGWEKFTKARGWHSVPIPPG